MSSIEQWKYGQGRGREGVQHRNLGHTCYNGGWTGEIRCVIGIIAEKLMDAENNFSGG